MKNASHEGISWGVGTATSQREHKKNTRIKPMIFFWMTRKWKLCARCGPRLLTIENLAYLICNPKEFLRRFVTTDETWIHHYTSESREGSKKWLKPVGNTPKRPKTPQSARQVMASAFCDAHRVMFIDYIEKWRIVIGAYYAALLDRLVDKIRKERPQLKRKKIPFYADKRQEIALW